MGAGESTPVTEPGAESPAASEPMTQQEALQTLEKVVVAEYGKIQDELASSAEGHAKSVAAMVSFRVIV